MAGHTDDIAFFQFGLGDLVAEAIGLNRRIPFSPLELLWEPRKPAVGERDPIDTANLQDLAVAAHLAAQGSVKRV